MKKHSESMQVACIGLQIVVEKTTLSVYTVNLYMYVCVERTSILIKGIGKPNFTFHVQLFDVHLNTH